MTDFLTADTNLPSYMIFPRFLLDMEINETAKMLYIILLDRARLSQKNEGWSDTDGHVFIYFTIEALAEVLHKSQMTVKTALAVLEKQELIFRKRQRPGQPNRIYVKLPKETIHYTDRFLCRQHRKEVPDMAIYHMQAKIVSHGSGRSAVAASAYMSCSRMYNDYDGIQHDYTRKQGLIYQEVMLPPMAPLEWNDREQLWNAVEETEKTKDSRLAREFVVALPVELDKNSNISLLQDFIQNNFVDMGMCADFAIHDTDGHNPHAHILLTVRPLNENGTWQYKTEKEYLCIKDGQEKGFTASEFKTAQKQGWEKQYRYKVGKKKEYLTSSVAQEKGYERIDKHPKSSRYGRQNPISEQWNSDEQLCIWRANWADLRFFPPAQQ